MLTETNARVARLTPANGFSATLQRIGRRARSFTASPRSSTKRLDSAVPVYVFLSNPAPGQHERVVRALGDLLAEAGLELESSADWLNTGDRGLDHVPVPAVGRRERSAPAAGGRVCPPGRGFTPRRPGPSPSASLVSVHRPPFPLDGRKKNRPARQAARAGRRSSLPGPEPGAYRAPAPIAPPPNVWSRRSFSLPKPAP
jgi:hypothetical protein